MISSKLTCETPPGRALTGEFNYSRRKHEAEQQPFNEPECNAVMAVILYAWPS